MMITSFEELHHTCNKKTKTKQWHFKLKKHKKVTTSLPFMEPTMEGCLLGSFKCCLKLIWLTWGQAKEEALGCSKVLHKGLKNHKKEVRMNFKLYLLEGACVPLEGKLGDGGGRM